MTEIVLVDGRNNLFRHAHVHNMLSRSEDGFPTGAIFGCINSMLSLHKKYPEAAIAWVWDGKGETWRHKFMQNLPQLDSKEFPEPEDSDESEDPLGDLSKEWTSQSFTGNEYLRIIDKAFKNSDAIDILKSRKEKKRGYKAQRHRPELEKHKSKYPDTPRERALLQIPVLQAILKGLGIRNYEVESLECDDLIGMLTKKIINLDYEAKVYIDSGDKDYYQLLTYPNVRIIAKKDGKTQTLKARDIEEEYGVRVKDWAKYRALTGDSSDNIPNLRHIGPVRAKQMLAAGIDPSHSHCPEIDDKFEKYFPHGTKTMWPSVNGNYKLCKLVLDPDDELLSEEVQEKLAPMFSHLDSTKRFYRSSKGKTPDAFRKVTWLLTRNEMSSILARRNDLFAIP